MVTVRIGHPLERGAGALFRGPVGAAIEQLEAALASYDGTLLLVTHDRRLAAAVPVTAQVDVTTLRQPRH